jgi:hypothetical protein
MMNKDIQYKGAPQYAGTMLPKELKMVTKIKNFKTPL